jgi:hypothetical protein
MAASGLTFLQIVNRVLARLRETAVATFNETDYSSHVAQVVNQVKTEIEDAWQWYALRDSYTVSAVNPTISYALTGTGMNAVVMSAWNRTHGLELEKAPNAELDRTYFGTPTGQTVPTGAVSKYVQNGLDDDFDIKVDIAPPPDTTQALLFNVYVPQADLAADATVPLVPQNLLIEETIARMQVEKGDEEAQRPLEGETFIKQDLLDTAISRDQGVDPTEQDWEPE